MKIAYFKTANDQESMNVVFGQHVGNFVQQFVRLNIIIRYSVFYIKKLIINNVPIAFEFRGKIRHA